MRGLVLALAATLCLLVVGRATESSVIAALAETPEPRPLTLIGQFGGPALNVEIVGGRAYWSLGSRIMVSSLTSEPRLDLEAEVPTERAVRAMAARGDELVVADSAGTLIRYDLSVTPPRPVHQAPGPASVIDLIDAGPYLAASSSDGLTLLDPESLESVASSPGFGAPMAADGNVLLAQAEGDLVLIRTGADAAPREVGRVDLGPDRSLAAAAVAGDHAMLAVMGAPHVFGRDVFFVVVDISDASMPRVVADLGIDDLESVASLAVLGDSAVVVGSYRGAPATHPGAAVMIDVSEPTVPTVTARDHWSGPPADVALATLGDQPLMVTSLVFGGLRARVLPEAEQSWHRVPALPRMVAAENMRVVVGSRASSTAWGIDATEASMMRPTGPSEPLTGMCWAGCRATLRNGLAYVADSNEVFAIFDTKGDAPPTLITHGAERPGDGVAVAVRGDLAVLGAASDGSGGTGGVVVLDVADPRSPVLLGRVSPPVDVADVELGGDLAVVVADGAVVTIDVSDPREATVVGRLTTIRKPTGVAIGPVYPDGRRAYVATNGAGLAVVRLSDSSGPQLLGELPGRGEFGPGADVLLAADRVFVTGQEGLREVDVRDPENPVEVRVWSGSEFGFLDIADAAADGDRLYVVDGSLGLFILSAEPESPRERHALFFPVADA